MRVADYQVTCPGSGNVITGISFADYGTPVGSCGTGFATGQCGSANAPRYTVPCMIRHVLMCGTEMR
jgi:hypothetical protein